MRLRFLSIFNLLCVGPLLACQFPAQAAEWNPQAFTKEDTVQIRTVGPVEGEYWFPVWLVVLDGQVYVRLGTRASDRVTKNTTAPYVAVMDCRTTVCAAMKASMVKAVADAMAEILGRYLRSRYIAHPLTLRLIPEEQK